MRIALSSLKDTVEMMSETVKKMNSQRTSSSSSCSVNDDDSGIKAELQSIKSLLLNRSQFPSIPASLPVLPSWQTEKRSDSQVNCLI